MTHLLGLVKSPSPDRAAVFISIGEIACAVGADINPYLEALKRDATYAQVGLPDKPPVIFPGNLIFKRRSWSGSIIGGMAETQEMLDYCAEKGITADVEVIKIQQVNEAFERVVKADVKYRFVIDMASLGA